MPIRFRCVYCDKLLGIARRKANTVVNCPQCGQALIVPAPPDGEEDEDDRPPAPPVRDSRTTPPTSPTASGPRDRLFESNDFEDLVEEQDSTQRGTVAMESPSASSPQAIRPSIAPSSPPPRMTPSASPSPSPGGGLVLSGGKLILLMLVVLILIAAAFGAGFFVGKSLNG